MTDLNRAPVRTEIVFITSDLADISTLLDGLPPGAEVHVLDAAQDGLAQMVQILAGRGGVDAIHLLSHGASGSLQLGTTTLVDASLQTRAAELAQIGQSLSATGDILLYGCNVAEGETGAQFVGRLAQSTGADVAASTNLTGSLTLGGDWVLESTSGQVDGAELQVAAYRGVLYTPGDAVIDLGASGKLIAPVQVEGKWYYHWDRSGDGTSADTGSLNGGVDYATHDVLDGIFKYDSTGGLNPGADTNTTDTYRYATINGVQLALPTMNGGSAIHQGFVEPQNGTVYSFAGAANDPTANSNTTYEDLLAVWDAKNGTGLLPSNEGVIPATYVDGTPSGWQPGGYWSATPAPDASSHAYIYLDSGKVWEFVDGNGGYVAVQVLFGSDTTAPTVSSVAITTATGIAASTLNAGDVVSVTVTMSEATTVTGTPNLALNIGGTTVQASYASGTGTTALVFNYTILAAQTDASGISIAANALSLNSGTLADAAGNNATLTHALVADNTGYLVDTTFPTVTHTSAAYTSATDTLVLTGTNFATLLETGETASTDIKARLDWSKLSWDINGDDATTANVSFALADISSAVVTNGTQLTVVLSTVKGAALEATSGYGGTPADTLDISAGFAKDVSGNAATTDAVANAALTITPPR